MAALHSALQSLGPCHFADLPTSSLELETYVGNLFSQSQLILESVPIPPPEDKPNTHESTASSAVAAASASKASEVTPSLERSAPPTPEHYVLQKEWGKPIKLASKDNSLSMAVYKLSGKDSRGAWFARRSVHEGIGFSQFKKSMQKEFEESLAVKGGPGAGNVRGIGGDRKLEDFSISGKARVEVFELSAQFPGPTTPRDFVTLLITSSEGIKYEEGSGKGGLRPRHYIVISKPCDHPEAQPRDGYVRGNYESLELIREVPRRPRRTRSSRDMSALGSGRKSPLPKSNQTNQAYTAHLEDKTSSDQCLPPVSRENSRRRGKTMSFLGSTTDPNQTNWSGRDDGYDAEQNPVEWIMVTRSDPGGSVPRFMVERGTPTAIVADAYKFLDWACQKQHDEEDFASKAVTEDDVGHRSSFTMLEANGHLAGLQHRVPEAADSILKEQAATEFVSGPQKTTLTSGTALSSRSEVCSEESRKQIIPEASIIPLGEPGGTGNTSVASVDNVSDGNNSDTLSSISFASVGSRLDDHAEQNMPALSDRWTEGASHSSTSSPPRPSLHQHISTPLFTSHHNNPEAGKPINDISARHASAQEHAWHKFRARRANLDAKLALVRQKSHYGEEESQSVKDKGAIRKAEEKHQNEVKRQEAKYRKGLEKLEAQRQREESRRSGKDKAVGKRQNNRSEAETRKGESRRMKTKKVIEHADTGHESNENTNIHNNTSNDDIIEAKSNENENENGVVSRKQDPQIQIHELQLQQLQIQLDAALNEIRLLKNERNIWRDQVGQLQQENTELVVKVGKLTKGEERAR